MNPLFSPEAPLRIVFPGILAATGNTVQVCFRRSSLPALFVLDLGLGVEDRKFKEESFRTCDLETVKETPQID